MAKNPKKAHDEGFEATNESVESANVPAIPAEIMSILRDIANKEPEVVKVNSDARSDVLVACTNTLTEAVNVVAATIERIAQCAVEAPNYPVSYDQH